MKESMIPTTTLLHGDCLELMKDIPDKSIDAIICDLPYGITQNRWDFVIPLDKMWAQLQRIRIDSTPIVLFADGKFTPALQMSNIKEYRYDLIWDKKGTTGFLNAKRMPLRKHEKILLFYKRLPTYNPQMVKGKARMKGGKTINNGNYGKFDGDREAYLSDTYYPTSIIEISGSNQRDKMHPTAKPVELMEYLIKTYTNEGETVLDFTMGSGTTGVACVNLNRNFIGMELDEGYFNIATNRIQEAKNNKTLF